MARKKVKSKKEHSKKEIDYRLILFEKIVLASLFILAIVSFWSFITELIKNIPSLSFIKSNLGSVTITFFILFFSISFIYSIIHLGVRILQRIMKNKPKKGNLKNKS